MAKYKV